MALAHAVGDKVLRDWSLRPGKHRGSSRRDFAGGVIERSPDQSLRAAPISLQARASSSVAARDVVLFTQVILRSNVISDILRSFAKNLTDVADEIDRIAGPEDGDTRHRG